MSIARTFGVLLIAISASACTADLADGSLLDRPRVFGARLVVEGDDSRAEPFFGESVTVRWLVDSPARDAEWTSAVTACVSGPAIQGIPVCASEPFAIAPPTTSAAPTFSFTVPDADVFGAAPRIAIAGVLCANGTPTLPDDGLPECEPETATREIVTFIVDVATSAPPNRHPSFRDDALELDGDPWPAPTEPPPATGCARGESSPGFPDVRRLSDEEPSVLRATTDADDREVYQRLVFGEDAPRLVEDREDLTISHIATAGTMQRPRSEVFEDAMPAASVEWTHPDEVPAGGLTVRFLFVLRDGRGGVDLAERALCLTNAPGS